MIGNMINGVKTAASRLEISLRLPRCGLNVPKHIRLQNQREYPAESMTPPPANKAAPGLSWKVVHRHKYSATKLLVGGKLMFIRLNITNAEAKRGALKVRPL